MSNRMVQIGELASGEELLDLAWEGDAEGIDPGKTYKRVATSARGRASIVVGAGHRRHYFLQVSARKHLTERQQEVVDFLRRFADEHSGMMPTIREIGTGLGISSTNAVNDHLNALERKGYIERTGGLSRALRLTHRIDWKRRALQAEAEVARLTAMLKRQGVAT